jgi:hypothetical protein
MKWLSLILLCLSAQACAADSVQAAYDVFMSGMKVGTIEENYTKNGDRYTLSSVTTPVGLLAMFKPEKIHISSHGKISPRGLKPHHFEDRREGNPGKSSKAEFDWEKHQLTLIRQSLRATVALPEGTQDRLSAMYQFMFTSLDHAVEFPMTNGSKLDNYRYTIGAREKLDTPAGQFDSVYLDSQGKPGESRTEIWLSAEYQLPCKMIITDANGDQFTQILTGLKVTP